MSTLRGTGWHRTNVRRTTLGAVVALLLLGAVPGRPAVAVDRTRPRDILLLAASPRPTVAVDSFERAFRSALKDEIPGPINLHFEYTDLALDGGEQFEPRLLELLRVKYQHLSPDLVVVTHSRTLRFVMSNRAALFPRTPIVFGGVDRATLGSVGLGPDVTGVWLLLPWARTLEIALGLHPGTRRVVVLAGTSSIDRTWLASARAQLGAFAGRLSVEYLTDLSLEGFQERVAALPAGSILLVGSLVRDGTGQTYVGPGALARIVRASSTPVYTVNETIVGVGAVGGLVMSWEALGERVAELSRRVLLGERPPPDEGGASRYVFDARQLRRWGLDERRLPAGSLVRFQRAPAWDLYKWYILGAAALVLTQGLLISLLLVSRAHRRRAQFALAERLRFETLLSDLVATLVTPMRPTEVDRTVQHMLERLVEDLAADRASLAEPDHTRSTMRVLYSWARTGIASIPETVSLAGFPWMWSRLWAGQVVRFSSLRELPEAGATDRVSLAARGVRSLVAVPVILDGTVTAALGLSTLHSERSWPDELVPRLQVLADVFAGVLARTRAQEAARASEEQRRQAEEEAQRQREDLAHVLRVTTLSELAAALAHEISQPLGAILSNTQAARRFLEHGRGAPGDVASTLADIGADARRAAQIIHRMRGMFSKNHVQTAAVDVNTLVQDVVGLLRTTLGRRAILVRLTLGVAVPPVEGDAIQLQQVVVNLVVNAADAIEAAEAEDRIILVETRLAAPGHVVITVRDSGIGLKESELDGVFEHFVSSKPNGLGMGLAISRSIVQAHGGRIWATRNEEAGLTLHVELPCGRSISPA